MPWKARIDGELVFGPKLTDREYIDIQKRRRHEQCVIELPCCGANGWIRKSSLGNIHFYHPRKCSDCPVYPVGGGPGDEHDRIQELIFTSMRQCGAEEVDIDVTVGDYRADTFCTYKGSNFDIEIQISPISASEIIERNKNYRSQGLNVAWLLRRYPPGFDTDSFEHKLLSLRRENAVNIAILGLKDIIEVSFANGWRKFNVKSFIEFVLHRGFDQRLFSILRARKLKLLEDNRLKKRPYLTPLELCETRDGIALSCILDISEDLRLKMQEIEKNREIAWLEKKAAEREEYERLRLLDSQNWWNRLPKRISFEGLEFIQASAPYHNHYCSRCGTKEENWYRSIMLPVRVLCLPCVEQIILS